MAGSIGLVVVVWAVNFIAAKVGLRYLPPVTMASFRVVLAGIAMVPAYLVCSRLPGFRDALRFRERGFTRGDIWTFLYLGFFGVVVNQMCFTMGLHYTSVSHAAVIVGMGPMYTLVLAVLFRLEKATAHKVMGMVIAFAGVAVMGIQTWPHLVLIANSDPLVVALLLAAIDAHLGGHPRWAFAASASPTGIRESSPASSKGLPQRRSRPATSRG